MTPLSTCLHINDQTSLQRRSLQHRIDASRPSLSQPHALRGKSAEDALLCLNSQGTVTRESAQVIHLEHSGPSRTRMSRYPGGSPRTTMSTMSIESGDTVADMQNRWERTWRPILASCARVCRAFSEPATAALWRSLDDIEPLLRVLPTVKLLEGPTSLFVICLTTD